MKKILSLILVSCVLLGTLILPSCGGNGNGTVTTPSENAIPDTPEALISQCLNKTAVAFFGEPGETFDVTNGIKANLYLEAQALSNLKLNTDFILAPKDNGFLFGLNVKNLSAEGMVLDGIRLYLTEAEIVAGFDALLSRNLGMKFSEAEDQITALVSKLMPGTSVSSIRTEVKSYLQQIEEALGTSGSSLPAITDEMATDIAAVVSSYVKMEQNVSESGVTLNVSFSLSDIINIVNDSIRVLKDDDAWRAFINDFDNTLKETLFAETSITLDTTVLEYIVSELESALADEGLTTDSFILKADALLGLDTLVKSANLALCIGDAPAVSFSFNASYEGLASFTLLAKVHKHAAIETTEDKDVFEVKFEKTAKNATSSGFILTATDKNAASESDSEGTVNTFSVEYTKDSSDNRYELAINTITTGTNVKSTVLSIEGKTYENKNEAFYSIEEIGSDAMGVSLIVDLQIKVTAPAEADMKLPVYDDLGSIKDAELKKITDFFSSLFPEEGNPEVDVNDSVLESGKAA